MTQNETDYEDFNFEGSSGAAVMEERAAQGAGGGDYTPRLAALLKEPGDTVTVRPLSGMDRVASRAYPWITVGVHNGVKTRPAPQDSDKKAAKPTGVEARMAA